MDSYRAVRIAIPAEELWGHFHFMWIAVGLGKAYSISIKAWETHKLISSLRDGKMRTNPVIFDCAIVDSGRSKTWRQLLYFFRLSDVWLPISDYGERQTADFVTCISLCLLSDCSRIIILCLFSLTCLFSAEEKTLPFLEVVIILKFWSGNNIEICKW